MDSTSAVDSATLAFNLGPLLTTILTNTLWAYWLAVITAAFSFWRLRPTTPTPKPDPTRNPTRNLTQNPTHVGQVQGSGDCEEREEEEEGVLTRGSSMKERLFNFYYYDEDHVQEEECHVREEDEMLVMSSLSTVEMRGVRELGWYRYQHRNVIDGSVVRLWDGSSSYWSCPRRLMVEVKQPFIFV